MRQKSLPGLRTPAPAVPALRPSERGDLEGRPGSRWRLVLSDLGEARARREAARRVHANGPVRLPAPVGQGALLHTDQAGEAATS